MERFTVDPEIIKTYQEEGVCCIKGAFKDWVPKMLEAHDKMQERLEAVVVDTGTFPRNAEIPSKLGYPPLSYGCGKSGQFGIRNAVFADPVFEAWMLESPAADILGQVLQAKTMQFWWDQSFCKSEHASPEAATPWHTDAGAFSWSGDMLPSLWIAGTDVGPGNSPLLTVVGSHKDKRWFRPVVGKDDISELPENYYERDEIIKVVEAPNTVIREWVLDAGDCLVIHPFTYHASTVPDPDAGRRIAFTSRWLGDDIRWNKREMTFDYPDDGRFKNVVQNEPPPTDGFPILWRSSDR